MPDEKGNLYLFEAIELRNEYDRHIKLIQSLLAIKNYHAQDESLIPSSESDSTGFSPKEFEIKQRKLEAKRIKLNMAIQLTNFETTIDFDGEQISLTEALEVRKKLLSEISYKGDVVRESAFKQIIHKEERDIVKEPMHLFKEAYEDYQNTTNTLRRLLNIMHISNHKSTTNFRDE
jgi:hypothetical protein